MKKISGSFIGLISIVLVIGFLSGIVGELWLNSFLMPNSYVNFKSYSDLSHKLDELLGNQNKTKTLNTQDTLVNNAIAKVRPSIVGIYRDKNFTVQASSSLLQGDYLGQGIIVTNDGWIMSHVSALKNDKSDFWVVTSDRQVLKSEKVISDEATGAFFLKVAANGLSVAEFNLRENLVQNQAMFVFGFNNKVIDSSVRDLNYSAQDSLEEMIRDSETFYKFIELNDNSLGEVLGSPVVTLDGKVSGLIISKTGLVLPIDHVMMQMRSVIRGETWARPYLGIRYYDLSEVMNAQIKDKQGALILNTQGVTAISPAKGLLQAGDIILEIEKEEISAKRNLTELVATYHVGDKIQLKVKRENEIKEIEIVLGELK